jgi:hypothetical protein
MMRIDPERIHKFFPTLSKEMFVKEKKLPFKDTSDPYHEIGKLAAIDQLFDEEMYEQVKSTHGIFSMIPIFAHRIEKSKNRMGYMESDAYRVQDEFERILRCEIDRKND